MNQGPSLIGRTLSGRYQIEQILGLGSMTTVYKARDLNLRRDVAIEILSPQLAADAEFVRGCERELATVVALHHPNIEQTLDFNHDGDVYYIVREYIVGETLQRHLQELSKAHRQLPIDTALEFTLNISNALAYAHARGQVHLAIKPASIVLAQREAILIDFGIAKMFAGDRYRDRGVTIDTPHYMSPEAIRGEAVDRRSDIYSLGVTLYEMLAGRPPFEADSSMAVMLKHVVDPVPDLLNLRPNVPPGLVRIVERCLAKNPTDRYQSAAALAADLQRIQTDLHPSISVDVGSAVPDTDETAQSAPPPDDNSEITSPHVPVSARPSLLRTIFEFFIGDRTAKPQQPGPLLKKKEGSRTPSMSAPPTIPDKPSELPVDEVSFTAYHQKEGRVDTWYSLLVYAHVASALVSVRQDAHRFDEQIRPPRETTSKASVPIARGTQITIIPTCNGVTFNPERIIFTWAEAFHRADFRFKADPSLADAAANGQISIYAGPLIIGTLRFAMLFHASGTPSVAEQEEQARMYLSNRIFISYSHKDTDFALVFRNVLKALGYEVLMDIDDLRAGQVWSEELMRLIERADIFQLFWSSNSSQSEYCRREWQLALKQDKPHGFIRPIYWQKPLPPPPEELNKLHFDYVELKLPMP